MTWWILWRVPALLLIVMVVWWYGFRPIAQEQGWVAVDERFALCAAPTIAPASGPVSGEARPQGCVIDGDTVILGFGNAQRRIRLTGFDAPELDGACEAEIRLAQAARQRLHAWLSEGPFEWNGAADPPRDRYGRELRSVRRIEEDGRREYLADVMTSSGLATEGGWGADDHDWCS